MKYINKYLHSGEAHDINVEFLEDCYQGPDKPFIPRVDDKQSFEDFKKKKYRHGHGGKRGWEEVMFEEQEGRCCYCMRTVVPGKLNIEHIVPRALCGTRAQVEYAQYASKSPAIRDFVEVADVFARKQFANKADIDGEQKMPHTTAEANLLLACNGKRGEPNTGCCCNNSRQDAYMLPLMLMEECDNRVDYDENGLMSIMPEEETLKSIVKELNDETLKTVRKIWFEISGTQYSVDEIRMMTSYIDKVLLLKTAFGVSNFEVLSNTVKQYAGSWDNQGRSFYWDLLLSYDWFYSYYHNRRNRVA